MKKLNEISPKAILAAAFLFSMSLFQLVDFFPSQLYRIMDISSYLVFHNVAEFFSIIISFSIFEVGWFTYEQSRNRHALFLSCAFLAIGLMDFMHTLGYSNMPAFVTPNSPLKSTQFWIAARLYAALAFLISGYVRAESSSRFLSKWFLLACAVVVPTIVFIGVTFFPSSLPATFIEGKGLTPFKSYSEYLVIILLALSIPPYWRRYVRTGTKQFLYYIAAFILCMSSEYAFSGYKSVFDTNNVVGHIYKVIAFYLIYKGIFIAAVKSPYIDVVRESEERQKAEQALGAERKRFNDILEMLPAYLVLLTPDYRVTFANRFFCERFGEAHGRRCYEYLFGRSGPCEICETFTVLKTGTPHHWEWTGPDKRNYDIFDFPFSERDGSSLILEMGIDITERKKAEESLRQSEVRFRNLVETTSDWIWEVDKNGVFTYASPAILHLLGYEPEEILGKTPFDLMTQEEAGRVAGIFSDIVADRRPINYLENISLHKDGQQVILETCGVPFFGPDGEFLGYRGIDRDITERKRTEESLRLLERKESILNRIASIFLTVPNSEMYGDVLKIVCEVTHSNAGIFGYIADNGDLVCPSMTRESECTVLDKTIIFPPNTWEGSLWGRAIREKTTLYSNESFVIPQCLIPIDSFLTGAIVFAEKTVGLLSVGNKEGGYTEEDKKLYEAITAFIAPILSARLQRDSQERQRKKAEEALQKSEAQLRHSQKMEAIGTLAGGVAHDFNNILNVIIGYGVMALERLKDDRISAEHINEVLAAADRAALLTKRLLTFSRKQAVEMKSVNINEVIVGMEKMIPRLIGEDVVLTLELAGSEMILLADAAQMEQVIMNLVSNARDAMPYGGRLTIGTELRKIDDAYVTAHGYGKPGSYALISVTDTGAGMDEETQKKIFEPFFTTKGVGEGTGLGLAIAYGIIKQHDGYIQVYSERGKGTIFKILLPVVKEKASAEQAVTEAAPVKGGTETILIAEDEPALRKLMRVVLESLGYKVITAEDGEDAISRYIENKDEVKLVVLDMIMPKKSGKETLDEIRRIDPDVKAVFVSGYTMDLIHRRELLGEGMGFILKPISPKDFLRKVRELLDR